MHNKTELTLSDGDTWIAQYNIELQSAMTQHNLPDLPWPNYTHMHWDKSGLQTKSEALL